MNYEVLSSIYYKNPEKYDECYRSRITSDATILLPFLIHDNSAFYINIPEITKIIISIYKRSEHINNLCSALPTIAITSFINKALVEEIMITNEIEGIRSTRKEVESAISLANNPSQNKTTRFEGLAKKYIKLIFDEQLKLDSCQEIRKLYDDIVLDEINDTNKPDGVLFRKESVSVYSSTQKEKHRGILPESKIIEVLNQGLSLFNDERLPVLISTALFHYLFGYVHPFYDGNGRTSRFISSIYLKSELNILMALRLSYIIKDNKNDYYNAFDLSNDPKNKGDLTPFVLMFITLINKATYDIYNRLDTLNTKLKYYYDLLDSQKLNIKEQQLLYILVQDSLFGEGHITRKDIAETMKLSISTINTLITKLSKNITITCKKESKHNVYSLDIDSLESYIKSV